MTQVSFTSNSKVTRNPDKKRKLFLVNWLLFICGSIFFFFALVYLKFHFEHHLSPSESGLKGVRTYSPLDLLFIGSSHTKQAIDVAKIDSLLNKKSFLLAYNGLDPTSIELVLKELLSDSTYAFKPKVLMLEIYVFSSARQAKLSDTKFFSQSPPTLKLQILDRLFTKKDEVGSFKQYYELIVSNNMAHILFFPFFNTALDRWMYKGSYKERYKDHITLENFSKVRADAISFGALETSLDSQALVSLKNILHIAKSHNLPLALHETPMPKEVIDIPSVHAAMQLLQTTIESEGVKYYNLGLEGSFPTNSPEMFIDWNHLSSQGRDLYSRMIADKINLDF